MKRFMAAIGVIIFLVVLNDEQDKKTDSSDPGVLKSGPAAPSLSDPPVRLIGGNPFIESYGRQDGSVKEDLELLRDVIANCQQIMKDFDQFHLPGNPEITGFLQGRNPEKLAWLPVKHPFINDRGELVDRDGLPVVFHRLSGFEFEYRSAGPDQKHWTDDDIVVR